MSTVEHVQVEYRQIYFLSYRGVKGMGVIPLWLDQLNSIWCVKWCRAMAVCAAL